MRMKEQPKQLCDSVTEKSWLGDGYRKVTEYLSEYSAVNYLK